MKKHLLSFLLRIQITIRCVIDLKPTRDTLSYGKEGGIPLY